MIRLWTAVAVLAASWLFGVSYYEPAQPWVWLAMVALGTGLLAGSFGKTPGGRASAVGLVLLLPAVWFAPWPYRAGPLLMAAGLVLAWLPIPRHWPRRLAEGGLAAGTVLVAQGAALAFYAAQTARSHELPWPLPSLLAGIASLLGMDAAADGSSVALHSVRQVHRLGATWELLVDPVTLGFLVGGIVMLGLRAWAKALPGGRWRAWLRAARRLATIVVAWLPIRAGLLMALYLHRAVRYDPQTPLHVMNQFLSPWVHLLALVVPVLLAWRFVRPWEGSNEDEDQPPSNDIVASRLRGRRWAQAAGLLFSAAALATIAATWTPVGTRKDGRLMVIERHSTWEPTTRPYDTTWYGEPSGYNYAAVYAYLGQFYQMSRLLESQPIDADSLGQCDVVMIKTPTARYAPPEVEAVVRFVEQGGSLLLIGDHTNYMGGSTFMNDITRHFGFTFRHDLLFGTGASPYDQRYVPPRVPHPAVQHLPPTDFAVSCSIDPGRSRGRAAIRASGLWSLPSDYHVSNFHPVPQHRPEMRYGSFIQAWATRHGDGRVLAFTDSTIFSNFCVHQPGKAELMLGMVEWLNHRGTLDPGIWLGLGALILGVAGLAIAWDVRDGWLLVSASSLCGWAMAGMGVMYAHRHAMPSPEPVRPMTRVVIDRTVSEVPLCKGAYTQGGGDGYGMLEQSIPRLGCYTVRARDQEAFSGKLLVVICPNESVRPAFRERLIRYVAGGGNLLVIDSPKNRRSTANSLLWPFGLSVMHGQPWQGQLSLGEGSAPLRVELACEVAGGEPVGRLGPRPVAATARHGQGRVMAVGFGPLWNDASMGASWMVEPDAETRARYEAMYRLVGSLLSSPDQADSGKE